MDHAPANKCLVVFQFRIGLAVLWDVDEHVNQWISDCLVSTEDITGTDYTGFESGVYVYDCELVDDGPTIGLVLERSLLRSRIPVRSRRKSGALISWATGLTGVRHETRDLDACYDAG